MTTVRNPVLPGFNPDPCIIRVGEYYYLATSTFEWFPGVRIHRSKDLAQWDLIGHALTRRDQINLRGAPDSGGVWAPGLSYSNGLFWLVYSDVKAHRGPFKDVTNYLATASDPAGPWSEPVTLNRSGFDPSLFHDTDGRKWLVNQVWKALPLSEAFAGIALQEYSVSEKRLIGTPVNIFRGSSLGLTEGPHLYRKDGYYYLVTAEGGTEWNHAVTVARSRSITGPYELSPHHPLLTSAHNSRLELQKAGHGSLVQTPAGSWYLAHLCSRHGQRRRCILGRETAIQQVVWPDGEWPKIANGRGEPEATFTIEGQSEGSASRDVRDDFDALELNKFWNTLREPADNSWLSLEERQGFLRLRGRNWLQCLFDQSLIGLRIVHAACDVSTRLEFEPKSFQQSAGLTLYYNTANFYYLYLTRLSSGSLALRLIASDDQNCREIVTLPVSEEVKAGVELSARLTGENLQFFAAIGSKAKQPVGPSLDASILSDDYCAEGKAGLAFTGTYAALCAQNASGQDVPADFDWFSYREVR